METVSVNSPIQAFPSSKHRSRRGFTTKHPQNYGMNFSPDTAAANLRSTPRSRHAVSDISSVTTDPVQAELTWQIVVGALAGVTPFVVAGVEFSKRIVAQRKCKEVFYHGNHGGDSLLVKK
ncbi:uncharacterized protein LOC111374192 isoform X3 [Olea europaea var. sylvestris]|uniref:uncharacterized protein LOC111374192 isoform X3 n=1 Tax=Olea europaea var. sylvestris TaxID=158386 RepID=UPI000C1D24A5|nr:uncharacterized protein LOC111374192 isoform X3 [Olea europaea var. sylvestris]